MSDSKRKRNSPAQVLFASLIGTTIEFFDFYIYATAAVIVFPKLFFPAADVTAATFASLHSRLRLLRDLSALRFSAILETGQAGKPRWSSHSP